jgi:PAS domain S-box-containing protein
MTSFIQDSKKRIFKNVAKIFFTFLLGLAIFILDVSLELGVAGGILYVTFVLMGLLYSNKRVTILLGIVALLLIITGFYLSPAGEQELWKTVLNRFYAIFVILVTTVFVYFYIKSLKEIFLKSDAKFKNLSNLTFEGILIHKNGVVVDMNLSFERMFGYSCEELLGKNIINILFPKKHHQLISKSIAKNYTRPFKIEGIRRDGSIFPVEIEARDIKLGANNNLRVAAIRDISERVETEEALMKSEEKFRNIVENTSEWIYELDETGVITYSNSVVEQILGHKSVDLIGKNNIALIYKPDRVRIAKIFLEKIKEKKGWRNLELRWAHKDGSYRYFESSAVPIINKEGILIGFRGINRDVTERKRVELQLKESVELTRSITQSAGDSIISINSDGIILSWNNASEKIFGYKASEMINKSLERIMGVQDAVDHSAGLKRQKNDNKIKLISKSIETFGVRKDGTKFPIDLNVSSWVVDNKKYYTGIIRDITERKKAEAENKKLSTVVAQSANTILITDTNGKIEYVNPRFTEITEYTAAEALGKTPKILSSGFHTKEFYAELWKTIKSGGIWKGEFQNKTKSGNLYWEQTTITPIKNEEGRIISYLAIKEDVTIQKEAEKSLRRALNKAEESDKLKSAFLANMSHEIRTPMNGIIGFSEFLSEPNLSENQRTKYARVVIDSSKQLLSIVNDILDISKIEAGVVQLYYESVNINKLLDELFVFYQLKAQENKIKLSYKKGLENNKSVIDIDKTKLNQVLANLLSNAFKFTAEGTIEFGYQLIDDKLQFYIKDTGKGIDKKLKNKIFDRFFQEDVDIEKQYGGTGLGLSITKKFIELFKGKIWFTSSKQGTTMYFTIPYSKKKKQITSVIKEEKQGDFEVENKELTVLVAEDQENNRMYINEVFSQANFKIIEAHNGKQAVELFKTHSEIDLVLMDIKMPIMNGVEAMKELKEIKPSLPIIAISAFAMESDKQKALEQGFDSYLSKPIDKNLLFNMIDKHYLR